MVSVLQRYVKEKSLGRGHKGTADDILKMAGIQGDALSHQFTLRLNFDALRQTTIDQMHRELLGMVKLHFMCIWATLSTEKRKVLATRMYL